MTTFEDRQRHLFNQLNEAEKQANFVTRSSNNDCSNFDDRRIVRRQARQTRAEMKQFRGKESIFKRPEAPLAQCLASRGVPGFRKNPDKWVCYNLENVPEVSDRSNSEAAAVCLKELEKQIEDKSNFEDLEANAISKVTFRQPIFVPKPKGSSSCDSKNIVYKNTTVVYPEHVVGLKEKEVRIKKYKPTTDKTMVNQLRLDHLHNDDENASD